MRDVGLGVEDELPYVAGVGLLELMLEGHGQVKKGESSGGMG